MGASERALGKVLSERGDRGQVLIISKGGHPPFLPSYPRPAKYLAPDVVRRDIGESLERLGDAVGYIDLYLLHRDDRRVPVGELITLLNEEVRKGGIRHFGVSNWRPERIEEANQYARAQALAGFVASQPLFTLAQHNEPESADDTAIRYLWPADRAWHERTQFPAFCYSPTAQGYFASNGKLARKAFDNAISRGRLERARQLAGKRGGGVTANQVALAYVRAQKFPAIPILGTAKLDHLHDALKAAAVKLTAEEAHRLAQV